ncbi:hypothetical protein PC116_g27787 [Phytophthora cactorum]|nr:hypothetical protein PC116_g27787 [Phytophthora cactorum]
MSQHVETVRIPSSYRENFQLYLDQHRKIAREAAADAVVEHYKNLRRRFPQHPYSHTGKPFRPFIPVVPYDTPSLSPAERAALVGKLVAHFLHEWHAPLCRCPRPPRPRLPGAGRHHASPRCSRPGRCSPSGRRSGRQHGRRRRARRQHAQRARRHGWVHPVSRAVWNLGLRRA